MQLKKEVIEKRLHAQLNRITEKRAAHEALFPEYKRRFLEVRSSNTLSMEKATNWAEWVNAGNEQLPDKPYLHDFDLGEKEKRIRRNLTILAAIEGRTIEVTALKTGRGLSLETIFDEE